MTRYCLGQGKIDAHLPYCFYYINLSILMQEYTMSFLPIATIDIDTSRCQDIDNSDNSTRSVSPYHPDIAPDIVPTARLVGRNLPADIEYLNRVRSHRYYITHMMRVVCSKMSKWFRDVRRVYGEDMELWSKGLLLECVQQLYEWECVMRREIRLVGGKIDRDAEICILIMEIHSEVYPFLRSRYVC